MLLLFSERAALVDGSRDVRLRQWAIGAVLVSVGIRAVFSGHIELLPEEAYYWTYSRHLDIGYLDHPPMVAWLIRVGTLIGGNTAWGVRVGALCCGLVASAFCFGTTRHLFGEKAALIALMFIQILPFFFLSGFLMTPDAPLTAAWSAFFYYFERSVAGRSKAWLGVGCSLGIGLLSKYTIGLAAIAAFAYIVAESGSRYWLRRLEPYLAALLAFTIFLPVLIWNYQHDWASFAFQTVRRVAEPPRFSLLSLIGSALILLGPIGFLTVFAVVNRKTARDLLSSEDPQLLRRRWIVGWLVGLPMGVFVVFSLRHSVKVDWTGAPWVAALPLMAYAMVVWRKGSGPFRAWLAAAWPVTLAVLLATYAVGFSYLAVGLPGVGYSTQMELAPVGWRELARQVERIAQTIETAGDSTLLIVGMDRYETASELTFYSRDPVTAIDATSAGHLFGGVGLMYERWFPASRTVASNLLLISWNRGDLADDRLLPFVDRLGPLTTGVIEQDGHFVRNYFYRAAYGYPKGHVKGPGAPSPGTLP